MAVHVENDVAIGFYDVSIAGAEERRQDAPLRKPGLEVAGAAARPRWRPGLPWVAHRRRPPRPAALRRLRVAERRESDTHQRENSQKQSK